MNERSGTSIRKKKWTSFPASWGIIGVAMAVSTSSWCMGAFPTRQRHSNNLLTSPHSSLFLSHIGVEQIASFQPGKYRGQAKTTRRLNSVAVLPLFTAELAHFEFTTFNDDWTLDEKSVKNIYLCFSLFFVWGCCVFGSMKDPFYDSDIYRDAGGDGSGNWIYNLEEEEEIQAREELWREELAREIEERVEELKELEEGKKEKELV